MSDERELTMAELKAGYEHELESAVTEGQRAPELPNKARPRERDDELLADPPKGDHHLGRFAGWRATRNTRLVVGLSLTAALAVGVVAFIVNTRQLRRERLHPLPEVEATIAPGTPREMTLSEGQMRVGLGREAPAINVVHLPDRDITLAPRVDKAQFKVEIRDGKTVKLVVLTGDIVETLTDPEAEPLLE